MYGFILLYHAMSEHPDAALTISVANAFGSDNKSILLATALSESEKEHLVALHMGLPEHTLPTQP
jgi:hypothetical protein